MNRQARLDPQSHAARATLIAMSLLAGSLGAGCGGSVTVDDNPGSGPGGVIGEDGAGWWALVHPSDAPLGPGLYLIDEETQEIQRYLALPPEAESPHGLAFDGTSLWVSDIVLQAVLQIDPDTGAVLSTIPDVISEGLVAQQGNLWYGTDEYQPAQATSFVRISPSGDVLDVVKLADSTIMNDIAHDGSSLYYAINDESDRILEVDPVTGAQVELAKNVAESGMIYTLAFDGQSLALIDMLPSGNVLRRFDPATGAEVSAKPFGVPGWVTALVAVGAQ
jgi:hypothetical protein